MIVNPYDQLQATNVISKTYTFHYKQWDAYLSQFMNDISLLGVTIKGPLFYSINNVPKDEIVKVEFFMPVEEDLPSIDSDMVFRSYFGFDHMVSITDFSHDETVTEEVYARLLYYINTNQLQQITPIFHVLSGDQEFSYTIVKICVEEKENADAWR
ncbi:DUF5085 family protein [Mesobacillus sp.]|uniref:DUF5085 family protein n=1 Tax=Mesobacillus sp. TaxID=2675271 RepID=UPI0039EE997A